MYEDYDDMYDASMSHSSARKMPKGDPTRMTANCMGGRTRCRVDHKPADIKEPSLDEGVTFVQSMDKYGY